MARSQNSRNEPQVVLIIGAGPAGLTAALELLRKSDILPVVVEEEDQPGGLSRTLRYKSYRMDIGGHRFFSKSDSVMSWWQGILPVAGHPAKDDIQLGRRIFTFPGGPDPEIRDKVLLVRKRLSRILYNREFYDYPLSLSLKTVRNLGPEKMLRMGLGYVAANLRPIRPEITLEDFFINRFGRELYQTFFEDYTLKVWGRPCDRIEASWGRQRIKGLSIMKALLSAAKPHPRDLRQKDVETSLIRYFLYPKYGPGQLWEEVAQEIVSKGGRILYRHRVEGLILDTGGKKVKAVRIRDLATNKVKQVAATCVFSSMPVKDLAVTIGPSFLPAEVMDIASRLPYRDFITVGLALRRSSLTDLRDNWIYVQEPDVKVGRLQLFNNWSPYLVPHDADVLWVGMEYFATEGDELWRLSRENMVSLAKKELLKLGAVKDLSDVVEGTSVRVKKAYPAYWDGYEHFDRLRSALDAIKNLYCVGRNGMHRYNNQDHSMLSAMTAVENIILGRKDKNNIWAVNAEGEYHEAGKMTP
jgi:protoporphyrinogen oxidase